MIIIVLPFFYHFLIAHKSCRVYQCCELYVYVENETVYLLKNTGTVLTCYSYPFKLMIRRSPPEKTFFICEYFMLFYLACTSHDRAR